MRQAVLCGILKRKGIGYYVGSGIVPLVCQSCLFDLSVGSFDVRLDKKPRLMLLYDGINRGGLI
jgi:L-aminopeptidase/D-esterase-like protein